MVFSAGGDGGRKAPDSHSRRQPADRGVQTSNGGADLFSSFGASVAPRSRLPAVKPALFAATWRCAPSAPDTGSQGLILQIGGKSSPSASAGVMWMRTISSAVALRRSESTTRTATRRVTTWPTCASARSKRKPVVSARGRSATPSPLHAILGLVCSGPGLVTLAPTLAACEACGSQTLRSDGQAPSRACATITRISRGGR